MLPPSREPTPADGSDAEEDADQLSLIFDRLVRQRESDRRAETLPPIDRLSSEKYRCIFQSEVRNTVGYPYVSGSAASVITPSQRISDLTSSKTATKYLGPDYHSFLSSDSESGLMGLLGILNGISAKHEEDRSSLKLRLRTLPRCDALAKLRELFLEHEKDLNTVYCCLLDFHEQDLPRESCGILRNEYRNFQRQLETFHIQLQKLHINHDAQKSDGFGALKKHEIHLDTLNQHLLSTYKRPAGWNFFDMRERAVQEKRLEKLHLGLLELHKYVARRDSLVYYSIGTVQTRSRDKERDSYSYPHKLWGSSIRPPDCGSNTLPLVERYQMVERDLAERKRSRLICIPDSSSGESVRGGVPTYEPRSTSTLETQSLAGDSLSDDNLRAQSSHANGGVQPALEHTEARSITKPDNRCGAFTDIARAVRSYIAQRFWEPPLEADKVRVRWTCVSVFLVLNPSFANPRSGVEKHYMMISPKLVPAQRQSWQNC
jgi:hypothetical protein